MRLALAFLLLCHSSLGLASAVPGAPLLGYGSSDAVIPAKDQELFFTGFEAGFEETLKTKIPQHLLSIEHVYNGSQLGAVEGAQRLLKKGVRSLIGFPTSHEALLVAGLARDAKVFTLFPAASHSALADFGPYVYSTGESMEAGVKKALGFLKTRFRKKQGVVIYSPFAVYSNDQKDIFSRLVSDPEYKDVSLSFRSVSAERVLSKEDLETLKSGGVAFIYLTQYASEATALMGQLQSQNIDIPIITNSSWLTGDIEFVRRYLTSRKSPLYSVGVWLKGTKQSREFEKAIRRRYGIEPTPEIAYGFDLGVVLAQVYRDVRNQKNISSEAMRQAFVRRRCFSGTSSGVLCFGPNGGHAQRSVQFVQFTKTGFVTVE